MKLSEEQIQSHLSRLSAWRREGEEIVRDLQLENFKSAMAFVIRVADRAEAAKFETRPKAKTRC